MRISDWSSYVCSSDLADLVLLLCRGAVLCRFGQRLAETRRAAAVADRGTAGAADHLFRLGALSLSGRGDRRLSEADRKSVVWGKSVSVRVAIGGRCII